MIIAPGEIDPTSTRPIADQLADVIRNHIASGKLSNGDPLPSVRDMARQVGHNKNTVLKAYHQVRDAGRLVAGPGQGPAQAWLVRVQPPVRVIDSQRFAEEWARLVAAQGEVDPARTAFCVDYGVSWHEYTVETDYEFRPALEAHAQLLRVPTGTEVLRRELIEHAKGARVQMRTSVMLASDVTGTVVAEPSAQPYPGGTLGELWHLRVRLIKVLQDVITRDPTPHEAERLDLHGRLQVWQITRQFVAVDQHGEERVVEVSDQVTPADGNCIRFVTRI